MNIAWLLLRAYRWPVFVALCAVLAVVHAMAGDSVIPVPVPNNFVNFDVPLGVFSPLLLACLIGLYLQPPTRLWDTGPQPQWAVRAVLATAVLIPAVLSSTPLLLDGTQLWISGVRNTLGLGGMALLTAVAAGASRSWMVVLPYLLASLLLGSDPSSVIGGRPNHAWWAFPIHEAGDERGAALAAALFGAGFLAYVLRGPRPEQ